MKGKQINQRRKPKDKVGEVINDPEMEARR